MAAEGRDLLPIDVRLAYAATQDALVTLSFAGLAERNGDYGVIGLDSQDRLLIPAGTTGATFQLAIRDDFFAEPSEFLKVRLERVANAGLPSPLNRVLDITLQDNDGSAAVPRPIPTIQDFVPKNSCCSMPRCH